MSLFSILRRQSFDGWAWTRVNNTDAPKRCEYVNNADLTHHLDSPNSSRAILLCSTHVAGTICGAQFGVSSNCQLCAVKVMSANGEGTWSDVIAGINHVVAKCSGVVGSLCVVNISLGSFGYNEIFNVAVSDAETKGVVVVVAAGNTNEDACSYSPASTTSAITVGSSTIADEKSSFSNWGTCVDVYAPGSDITSAWNSSPTSTSTFSGTSMASPRKCH